MFNLQMSDIYGKNIGKFQKAGLPIMDKEVISFVVEKLTN